MKAMGRREFLQVAAMLGVGGTAALLGTGCASGPESARAETGADESPAQDEPSAGTSTDASATASTAKSDAARGEQIDPPTASIEPAEPWLIDADTTPAITTASLFRDGFAQVGIRKVDWKTSTVYGCIDQAGRLLYYCDREFTATVDPQGATTLWVTSADDNGSMKALHSYALDQDGSTIARANGLSFNYSFLDQEEFSDVTSAEPITVMPPCGLEEVAANPLQRISSHVLVRHQQSGFTSYDHWEIRNTIGELLCDFEFDEEVTSCKGYTDPSESLFYIEAAAESETAVLSNGTTWTTPRYLDKVYHRVTQEWTDLGTCTRSVVSERFGDSYFLVDVGSYRILDESSRESSSTVFMRYEDGAISSVDFSAIGNAAARHLTCAIGAEQNGWVLLQAGYTEDNTGADIWRGSYSVETEEFCELAGEYSERVVSSWTSDTPSCTRTSDGEHVILLMQGDDGLSYAGVFDMAWNLLFDPVRADAVLGEEYDGKFAVGVSMTSSDASFVFYDLDGNVLRTIESSEGIVLRSTFTRTSQGIAPFERTDNPGVLGAIDLTGTILFEGIDVSQARKFVIEESEE